MYLQNNILFFPSLGIWKVILDMQRWKQKYQTDLLLSLLPGNVWDVGKVKLADTGARQFCKDYIYAPVYICLMGREWAR